MREAPSLNRKRARYKVKKHSVVHVAGHEAHKQWTARHHTERRPNVRDWQVPRAWAPRRSTNGV